MMSPLSSTSPPRHPIDPISSTGTVSHTETPLSRLPHHSRSLGHHSITSSELSGPPPPPRALPRPPPLHHRRTSSYIRRLELDAALDKEKFGLGNVHISTSPSTDEIIIHLDSDINDMSQPSASAPIAPSTATPPTINTRTANNMNVPSSSRIRNPPPPSPLSKMSSPTDSAKEDPPSPPKMHLSPPALLHAQTSPCFIHSHLDRHGNGSLQDWLSKKGQPSTEHHDSPPQPHTTHHNGIPPRPIGHSARNQPHAHFAHRPVHPPSHHQAHHRAGPSHATSPRRESTLSGYESDRSSSTNLTGSAILDGDFLDDEEDSKSLTRQLAETAQGVREMSKELGRTRVRSRIQTVLIVTKARDNRLIKLTRELALYLMQKKPAISSPELAKNGNGNGNGNGDAKYADRGMVVYVDAQLRHSRRFDANGLQKQYPELFQPIYRRRSSSATSLNTLSAYPSSSSMSESARKHRDEGQLRYWTGEMCSNSPHLFDFVVTLGGDGTVLFTSWLFQKIVPPVLPFALGSLGFLTNFNFDKYKPTMDKVIDDGIRVNLRMRFTCTVYRAVAPEEVAAALSGNGKKRKAIKKPGGEILINQVDKGGWEALEGSGGNGPPCIPCRDAQDKEIMCFSTRPVEQFEVLNDLVVDRGPSPFVSLLELFGDEHHLTTVQADGLTVSTPTGSTAYSLSAGGSLVHPQIPALLITPICPHTLSFRPMLLPDSMELRICVPYNSRSTAWASFDGRGRVELKQGDHIKVTASKYPFPTVCADKASTDWFQSISRTLRWNEREKQKSFVVVEEDNEPSKPEPKKTQGKKPHKDEIKAALDDPKPQDSYFTKEADSVPEEDEDEEEDQDEEEEEEYDIDEKSGGNTTPSSPKSEGFSSNRLHSMLSSHKSGVDSPDRFASQYAPPPPLSQRHLIEALAAAELQEKEHESGERDDIRGETNTRLTNGGHMIPRGREIRTTGRIPSPRDRSNDSDLKTPRATKASHKTKASPGKSKKNECKAKAFAFFGHDDSASDASDDTGE